MKKIPNFIIIAITIICINFLSCSKNSSPSTTTPPSTCANPSDCIVNTWYLKQELANYNGSMVTIFAEGGKANLINYFDTQYWVFANTAWTLYSSHDTVFDAGTWKILPDSIVEINSTYPDTFKITSITADTLNINIPYNHNYPSYPAYATAIVSGLDTAKLSAYLLTFTTTP
ncbi:MAG TPA: hypothetical protein VKR53_19990 [Puia sp.]|nr:hypothetical protein [Puia sp.]